MKTPVPSSWCRAFGGIAFGALALSGCLHDRGQPAAGYSSLVLSPGSVVPALEDDDLLRSRVDANDGIDGMMVPLRSGYAAGIQIHFWDFGVAASGAKPAWIFRRRGDDGKPMEVPHPDLIDSIPGDTNHTSFRMVYTVYVTAAWSGQKITSPQALEDAIELGLVEEPQWKGTYADWPVTLANVQLDAGPDATPVSPHPAYYRGRMAQHFKLEDAGGPLPFVVDKGPVPTPNMYQLRRQDEDKPLDETVWKGDLGGSADTTDTNAVFSLAPNDMGNTSLWKQIDVVVPSDYHFGTARAESDLFTKQMTSGLLAVPATVIEFRDSMTLVNRPLKRGDP